MPDVDSQPNNCWTEPKDGEIVNSGFRGGKFFRAHWDAKTKSVIETEVDTLDQAKEGE